MTARGAPMVKRQILKSRFAAIILWYPFTLISSLCLLPWALSLREALVTSVLTLQNRLQNLSFMFVCSDYNHFLRRRYRWVDTCLVALVFWHIDFSGSEKNMLDVCLGTVSVGSRSILNPLFCTFFDPWKSTFWRTWRQIDKTVGNAFFGDCSQGIHPLSTGTVLPFASLSVSLSVSLSCPSLSVFLCLCPSLFLSLSLSLSPSVSVRLRAPAGLPRTVYLVIFCEVSFLEWY